MQDGCASSVIQFHLVVAYITNISARNQTQTIDIKKIEKDGFWIQVEVLHIFSKRERIFNATVKIYSSIGSG